MKKLFFAFLIIATFNSMSAKSIATETIDYNESMRDLINSHNGVLNLTELQITDLVTHAAFSNEGVFRGFNGYEIANQLNPIQVVKFFELIFNAKPVFMAENGLSPTLIEINQLAQTISGASDEMPINTKKCNQSCDAGYVGCSCYTCASGDCVCGGCTPSTSSDTTGTYNPRLFRPLPWRYLPD